MKAAAIFLLAQITFGTWTTPEIPKNDPRPPVITAKLTGDEIKQLEQADSEIQSAHAALAMAEQKRDDLNYALGQKHRTPDTGSNPFCSDLGYRAKVQGNFVVYTLGYQQCRAM